MPTVSIPIDVCRSGVRLTPAAKAVLLALLSYGNAPTPSVARVAEDAGVSRRNIYRALALLRKEGYLQGTDNKNLAVGASASVAETPPPTTGSGATMAQNCANLAHSDLGTAQKCATTAQKCATTAHRDDTMAQNCANLAHSDGNIYIYNNKYIERLKEKDKEEEDNKKKIGLSPSSFPETTPLDVGDSSTDEDADARTALDCWNSSGHLAEWHYCEAWEAEYRRMREVFPEQALLLEAISRFSDYQQGRKGRDGGYGDNTRHFVGSYKVWSSDEALVKTFRSHQRRFWGEKTKGKKAKYRPYQDPRREAAPEPEIEPVPASELIPLAEAEPNPEHRARCLEFLRGPEASDPQARGEFDRQACAAIRREECDAGGDWERRAWERIEQLLMLEQRRAKRTQTEAPLMGMMN